MNNAVYLIAFIFVAVNVGAQKVNMYSEDMKVILAYHKDCKEISGVSDSIAAGTLLGHFPDDPAVKKHMLCMSQKFGFQNDDGILQKEAIKEKFNAFLKDPNRADELTEKCAVENDDPNETAFLFGICLYREFHPAA